ncbi:MFS transporter, partial [Thioclava sp. BHET1]
MTLVMTNAPRRSRVGYRIVLTGLALMMAGASAPSPFYPVLQQEIGFSDAVMAGVFAIYAVALLITLLLTGSLSDHLGRRPVLSIGFVLLAVSMVLFWQAESTMALLIARVVQGVASGLLLSTLTATSVDLEPADRPGTAPVWNSVIPLAGLGVGALVAGAIMDHAEGARADVFG